MLATATQRDPARFALRISVRQLAGAVLLLAWLFGAVLFLSADGSISSTLPRLAPPPEGEHNLALYRWGPSLRASSYFLGAFSQHHPIFLVDARAEPHEVEKWTSGYHDRKPWVEIGWREPRRLERVVIHHVGWRESKSWTVRRYRLSCLTEQGEGAPVVVTNNTEHVASHALPCEGARGLRVEWTPNQPDDQVRVYEIEAWGR